PLSPSTVRNSPSAISREMSRSTTLLPNVLATLRMRSSVAFALDCAFEAATFERVLTEAMYGSSYRRCAGVSVILQGNKQRLLRCLHIVPNLVVLGAARHILPEINPLLVVVDVVQMQGLHLIWRHELRRLRICRHIVCLVGDQFLRLGLNHVFQKLV